VIKKASLLYNPQAGHGRHSRQRLVESAAEVLREAGVATTLIETRGPQTATAQAHEALASGPDVLFACGGDGTVHEVLQAMVESRTEAALGIVPLGTGNVLANDLGIPIEPRAAAHFALDGNAERIPCGVIRYRSSRGASESRYFTVAAGVGSHATMIYQSTAERKNQHGMMAYYKTGFTLLFRAPFVAFDAEIVPMEGEVMRIPIFDVIAVRVTSFGGMLKRWRPGGSLHHTHLQLLLNRGARRGDLFRFVMAAVAGNRWIPQGLQYVSAKSIVCTPRAENDARVHAQADGEFLGGMPIEISVVPAACNILLPQTPYPGT
jgi:diacylglycerol kinase (ATP)